MRKEEKWAQHIIAAVALPVLIVLFTACATTGNISAPGKFKYRIIENGNNQSITITGYDGEASIMIIPETIKGIPVTRIGEEAFGRNKRYKLTGVILPQNLLHIGRNAFSQNNITSLEIPENVITIDNSAFGYNKLTSITIPNSVKTIGGWAFAENQLTSVTISSSVVSIGESAFISNRLTSLNIPESVTTIGNYAFARNQLTSVTIPASVKTIEYSAFRDNKLTSVTIPRGVTTIANEVFRKNLINSVTIPEGVRIIRERAFDENPLTSVTIPNGVTTIEYAAFGDHLDRSIDNDTIKFTPSEYGSLHPYISVYGAGTYTKDGERVLRNGQILQEPATIITDVKITGSGVVTTWEWARTYILSIDSKRPIQCKSVNLQEIIRHKNVDISKLPDILKKSTFYYGQTYVEPGMHSVEVTYFDITESSFNRTTTTRAVWSEGSVTFEHRYLFEGGLYKLTARTDGAQVIYRIEPQ